VDDARVAAVAVHLAFGRAFLGTAQHVARERHTPHERACVERPDILAVGEPDIARAVVGPEHRFAQHGQAHDDPAFDLELRFAERHRSPQHGVNGPCPANSAHLHRPLDGAEVNGPPGGAEIHHPLAFVGHGAPVGWCVPAPLVELTRPII